MTAFPGAALLAPHREWVATPSLSGQEGALVEHLRDWLAADGDALESGIVEGASFHEALLRARREARRP